MFPAFLINDADFWVIIALGGKTLLMVEALAINGEKIAAAKVPVNNRECTLIKFSFISNHK